MGLRRDAVNAKSVLAEFVMALGLPADAKYDAIIAYAKLAGAARREKLALAKSFASSPVARVSP